jgi:hypothetical protein
MAVCDVCSAPGKGTIISSEQMREAVFSKGFNPFKLGLAQNPMVAMVGAQAMYQNWKTTIVAQDTSDWNICPRCMKALKPYLRGAPKGTGVKKATVSADPTVARAAGAAAERKYKKAGKPAKKKWWEFWK